MYFDTHCSNIKQLFSTFLISYFKRGGFKIRSIIRYC